MKTSMATKEVAPGVRPPSIQADLERLPQIVRFLGGETVMKRTIETKLDVHILIKTGFPNGVLNFLIKNIPQLKDPSFLQKAVGMSARTSQRKNARGTVLTAEQSSKAWNFAEVMTQASAVFGSKEEGVKWLSEPAMALGGERPIDLLSTTVGQDLVKDLLTRLEFGVYA